MKILKRISAVFLTIVCISLFVGNSHAQNNSHDKGFWFTRAELENMKLIIEQKKMLETRLSDVTKEINLCDSLSSINKSVIAQQSQLIQNKDAIIELKETQLRKLEAKPTEIVLDTRRWYEIPGAVIIGGIAGLLIGTFLIQK